MTLQDYLWSTKSFLKQRVYVTMYYKNLVFSAFYKRLVRRIIVNKREGKIMQIIIVAYLLYAYLRAWRD